MSVRAEELPKNDYAAKVEDAYITEIKGGPRAGDNYVRVRCAITNEPYHTFALEWSGFFGDDVGKDDLTKTERTVKALRTAGWKGDDLNDLSSMIGTPVRIAVEHEDYKGTMYARLAFINSSEGGGPKPLSADKSRAFAASMRSRIAAASKKVGGGGTALPNPNGAGLGSDKPPF